MYKLMFKETTFSLFYEQIIPNLHTTCYSKCFSNLYESMWQFSIFPKYGLTHFIKCMCALASGKK